MSQNTVSLSHEIKRELRFLNLKWVFIVFGAIGVSFATALMISFAVVGLSPQGLLIMMFPTYGVALFVSGSAVGALIGGAVIIGFLRYSKSKVTPYVDAPKDIDEVREGLVGLGSYVAAKEKMNEDTYVPFNESWRNRIRGNEERELNNEEIIKQQQQKITEIETKINDFGELAYKTAGRFSIKTFSTDWEVRKLRREIHELKELLNKPESLKDIELQKLRADLRIAISSIGTSKEKIAELENRIKDLEAKK